MTSVSFSFEENWFKKAEKKLIKPKKINDQTIEHDELISYSQEYIDLLFEFLEINKKEMSSYAIITKNMVFYPPTYDEYICILYKNRRNKKNTKKDIIKYNPKEIGGYNRFPEKCKCYAYIVSYSTFISELAHMALDLVCFARERPVDHMVSEIFDGTMVINFDKNTYLKKRYMDADIYICLPNKIKSLINNNLFYMTNQLNNFSNVIYNIKLCELESLIKENIKNINSCLNNKGLKISDLGHKEEWKYVYCGLVELHIQAWYILTIYKEKQGNLDNFFRKLWLTIIKSNNLTFDSVSKILQNTFEISL